MVACKQAVLFLDVGRVEFTSFLPENTQAAIIQPIGNDGVLIAASNTQRGFTRLDQVTSCLVVFAIANRVVNVSSQGSLAL